MHLQSGNASFNCDHCELLGGTASPCCPRLNRDSCGFAARSPLPPPSVPAPQAACGACRFARQRTAVGEVWLAGGAAGQPAGPGRGSAHHRSKWSLRHEPLPRRDPLRRLRPWRHRVGGDWRRRHAWLHELYGTPRPPFLSSDSRVGLSRQMTRTSSLRRYATALRSPTARRASPARQSSTAALIRAPAALVRTTAGSSTRTTFR